MEQIHKRFTTEQAKALLEVFCRETLDTSAVEDTLEIGRSRSFALLSQYPHDPTRFPLTYERSASPRISTSAEREIEKQLLLEKGLIEDPGLPITS